MKVRDRQQFSVAMSVYRNDDPDYFRIALESVINQSRPPSEIVLIVDGPVPKEITNVITEYVEKCDYLKPVFLEENGGLGNALRIAVEFSSFELIARMDSDDLAVPDRFEKQLKRFELDDKLSILGGNISEFIEDENNIVGSRVVPEDDKDIKKYLKKRCPFNHVTVMFKKSEVIKAGNYKDWFWNEDYYLWIRMYEVGCRFGNLKDILVNVRVGPDMYKRRGGKKYFKSEVKLQKYMLQNGTINIGQYLNNISIRFIVQILLPKNLRGCVFRRFARKQGLEGLKIY